MLEKQSQTVVPSLVFVVQTVSFWESKNLSSTKCWNQKATREFLISTITSVWYGFFKFFISRLFVDGNQIVDN
jgi:hypothetical protein